VHEVLVVGTQILHVDEQKSRLYVAQIRPEDVAPSKVLVDFLPLVFDCFDYFSCVKSQFLWGLDEFVLVSAIFPEELGNISNLFVVDRLGPEITEESAPCELTLEQLIATLLRVEVDPVVSVIQSNEVDHTFCVLRFESVTPRPLEGVVELHLLQSVERK